VGDQSDASQRVTYHNSHGNEIAFEVLIECSDADFQITKNITKTSRRAGGSLKWLLRGCGQKGWKGG